MRFIIIASALLTLSQAQAQEKAITFAQLEANRGALAGETVTIKNVTVFGFGQSTGGMVRDATGGAKLDDAGMTPKTIYQLEQHCSRASMNPPKPECQGTLKFKVTLREELRGGFTVREAEFTPDR